MSRISLAAALVAVALGCVACTPETVVALPPEVVATPDAGMPTTTPDAGPLVNECGGMGDVRPPVGAPCAKVCRGDTVTGTFQCKPVMDGTTFCNVGVSCDPLCTVNGCDDNNQCTVDACDPSQGCVHTAVDNGTPCEGALWCVTDYACESGECVAHGTRVCEEPDTACEYSACDEASRSCVRRNRALNTPCDDGDACTEGDVCIRGTCTPGRTVDTDDNISCTVDACDPAGGALHTPTDALCQDDNQCTVNEVCDPAFGGCRTTALPNGSACYDGNVCTVPDTCQGAQCATGATVEHLGRLGRVRDIGYMHGPHVAHERLLCNSGFDLVALENHDPPPRCTNARPPRFVKYVKLSGVVHKGLEWCYVPDYNRARGEAWVAAHQIGVDPRDTSVPIVDIRDPDVYNAMLNIYLPCALMHGGDGIYVDTAGSLADEFSYLAASMVGLVRDAMRFHPSWIFMVNDGWNVVWRDENGTSSFLWDGFMTSAISYNVDLTLIVEGFWLNFQGDPWCDERAWYEGCRVRNPLVENFVLMDNLHDNLYLATQEHPRLNDCGAFQEAACAAFAHGASPIIWVYNAPDAPVQGDGGQSSFSTWVTNGACTGPLP